MNTREVKIAIDETAEGWPSVDYLQGLVGPSVRLVESKSPDFVVFGPHLRKKKFHLGSLLKGRRSEGQSRFVRIFWSGENSIPDFESYDWLFTYNLDDVVQHPRHLRRPPWHPDVPKSARPQYESKERFCNFIYSRSFPLRERFFDLLSKYKKIDAPGASRNNSAPLGGHDSALQSRYQSKDWQEDKLSAIRPYKFTIAFENTSHPGYVTEKIYHPMLVGSIPIYWGNPVVGRDYNTRSFLNAHDYYSLEELVERVIQVDQDDSLYQALLVEPYYSDNGSHIDRHLERVRNRFLEIFGA